MADEETEKKKKGEEEEVEGNDKGPQKEDLGPSELPID
jgi:hypothetical protein